MIYILLEVGACQHGDLIEISLSDHLHDLLRTLKSMNNQQFCSPFFQILFKSIRAAQSAFYKNQEYWEQIAVFHKNSSLKKKK